MDPVPLTILGGSERRPSDLSARGLHPIAGYKGVALRVDGRPLIELLVERAARAGFAPVVVAGPRRVYEPLGLAATLVDTDASVAENLRAAVRHHLARHGGELAVLACDVLPTAEELAGLVARHADEPAASLWFPFVRVPSDPGELGPFGWKPTYRVVPTGPEEVREPVAILPSHLCFFEPRALRLPLLYKLMDLAYATRNHSVRYRKRVMLRRVLASLLWRDVCRLGQLRSPGLTWTVVRSGLRLAGRLRAGAIELEELEALLGAIFLHPRRQRELGLGGFRFPLSEVVSLAKDVDTEEEARALEDEPPPR